MTQPRARNELFDYKGKTLYEWLPSVVERVAENFDPLKIVVFGSVARGDANY
nr:nucleotidyltransferase domain-containing protein [Rubrobacter sp.]